MMQALLIANAEGKKLYPLTVTMPSPMLPIVDRPVMVYAIELLARAGICDIFVSLSEEVASIKRYFGDGERWNVRLHYLVQHNAYELTDLHKADVQPLTETCLVLPAAALIDLDIKAALTYHKAHGGVATAILSHHGTDKVADTSLAALDTQGLVHPIDAAVADGTQSFHTGAFIFEPALLNYLPDPVALHDQPHLLMTLHQAGVALYGYQMDGYWNPLASFSDFQAAQKTYLVSLSKTVQSDQRVRLRYPYVEAGEVQPGIWVGPNSIIHPSVRLTAPLFIGSGCRIGRDVEVGAETVIGSGVVLDEGVTIQQSTVLSHTYVGQFLHLAQRVAHHAELIDVETGVNVQIADPWLLAMVNPILPSDLLRTFKRRLLALIAISLLTPLLTLITIVGQITTSQPIWEHVQLLGQKLTAKVKSSPVRSYPMDTRQPSNPSKTAGQFLEFADLHQIPE